MGSGKWALAAFVVSAVFCSSVFAFSGSGFGTESSPYVITDVYQLQEMSNDLGAYYILGNDIDASETATWNGGAGFEPVGGDVESFVGVFDGRGRRIINLYINRPTMDRVGVLGVIEDGALVANVGLENANVVGRRNSGTLVGVVRGATLSDSWATGSISGSHDYQMRLGGLVGISSGANSFVNKCFADVTVTATGGAYQVGGLAGYNGHGSIMTNCYALGDVSGYWKIGGLVGDNPYPEGGYIQYCYSAGKVTGIGGGLVGFNYMGGVTKDSYWDVQTSDKSSSDGGAGRNTLAMMQQATFVNWDFDETWDILENYSYPFLRPVVVPILVAVDIKPTSCPNPLNVKGNGVLPVTILGSEVLDVNSIDIASIRLAEIAPIRSSLEDVAGPIAEPNECDCTTAGPDGLPDLTLKFKTRDILEAIGEVNHDDMLTLSLTGVLADDTPFNGSDCILIRGKFKPNNRADVNKDGVIDGVDLSIVAENWLQSSIIEE